MYCPDTYQRINAKKVREYQEQLNREAESRELAEEENPPEPLDFTRCEFCEDNPATQVIPVYNPADKINGRGQDAYAVYHICDECADNGKHMEENFYCDKCGEFFIYNHSWEILAVVKDVGIYCQSCAAEDAEENGIYLEDLLDILEQPRQRIVQDVFQKLDNMPGKTLLWEGEYSSYSDFPGFTTLGQVAEAIREAAEGEDLEGGELVYPLVTKGRQFSVTLAVYY